jgi:cytosine/adenosine deaminase-related metal-dependent hydrolase
MESGRLIDHGPGAIMPVMVNAHTHLDLSALKNRTICDDGFIGWVKSVIQHRNALPKDSLLSSASESIRDLLDTGTLFIGDISSLGITNQIFLDSELKGILFQEQIGLNGNLNGCAHITPFKKISVSGHAPHTTSPSLLTQIKQHTRQFGLPFSIHLAESQQEVDFLATGKGQWLDLLQDRGIDTSRWNLKSDSPVQYADTLELLDEKTIAVHLIHSSDNDFDILSEKGVNVCACPRSNMKLHGHLPQLSRMIDMGMQPCLGTDSLASNDSLSMFDEMKFTAEAFPDISPENILAMATVYGSVALGIGSIAGSLHPGKNASFLFVPLEANDPATLLEELIHEGHKKKVKLIHHDRS